MFKEADLREKWRQRWSTTAQAIFAVLVTAAIGVLVVYLRGLWQPNKSPTSPGAGSPGGSNTSPMSSRAADTGSNP